MSTWDDYRQICIHGVREELDYHDCSKCKARAIEEGEDYHFPNRTFIYFKEKEVKNG